MDEEKYTCPHHEGTGGFESCCSCTGDRLCDEAPSDHPLEDEEV